MNPPAQTWSLVLAAGEGSRLRELTRDADGTPVPKQFCSLAGGPSLLQETLARARRLSPPDRIVVVVAKQHRRWWSDQLGDLPRRNLVVQPANRGTAAGVVLPLLEILDRDPAARVVALPSDHHVRRERAFDEAIGGALNALAGHPEDLVLLGITPDSPEPEYGWIVPARGGASGCARVESFVEKPDATRARRLHRGGALWSSFVFAAAARPLAALVERQIPGLVAALARARGSRSDLERLYPSLPTADFSRDVLQRDPTRLLVVAAERCGWTDLGTPTRLAQVVQGLGEQLPRCPRTRFPDLRSSLLRANALIPMVG